jgi:hypothetical protein
MASLRLVGIQCEDLLPGQSLLVWPRFLDSYVGSSPVTVNNLHEVPFPPDAVVNFQLRSDPIYLYINDQTILVSEDHIWDTAAPTNGSTHFRLLADTTGRQIINYSPVLHYTLN